MPDYSNTDFPHLQGLGAFFFIARRRGARDALIAKAIGGWERLTEWAESCILPLSQIRNEKGVIPGKDMTHPSRDARPDGQPGQMPMRGINSHAASAASH